MSVLSAQDFVLHCQTNSSRLNDALIRWDMLYDRYRAEFCQRRLDSYERFYGVPLSTRSSVHLCLSERYTACVNFSSPDGVTRHVCDILPIVIGSELDKRIRRDYWIACDRNDCDRLLCDRRKRGLIVQNKNLYHFTVTMATNPKVAHIYRKINKLNKVDSRVYYYDKNFRGNMFCFKQNVILIPCSTCVLRQAKRRAGDDSCDSRCNGHLRSAVVEELYLRNCFKQDYLLLRRICLVGCPAIETRHLPMRQLIERFVQQHEQRMNVVDSNSSNSSDSECANPLAKLGSCDVAMQRCNSVSMVKLNDVSLVNDLRVFVQRVDGLPEGLRLTIDKVHVNVSNDCDAGAQLLCNCPSEGIRNSFDSCSKKCQATAVTTVTNSDTFRSVGCGDSYSLTFVDNLQEFRKISDSCFACYKEDDDRCLVSEAYYEEQLYTIYIYMRQVIARNEDIDQLCNKCVFDAPYLYNKLLYQLQEYISHRVSVQDIKSVLVDTLVSRYRQLAHTANLYMLISSKTNIRVELANDMKRSLKLSVKREKMQQSEYIVSTCNSLGNISRPNDILSGVLAAPSSVKTSATLDDEDVDGKCGDGKIDDVNEKCDFVITASSAMAKTKNLCTELSDCGTFVYVASCNRNDVIARQLITYSGNYLLQNISAAHFTDLEFVFETIKRPSVANQHNSIKCSFMPRNAVRFLSYYNMGNLSSAGRTLNVCFRNTITFFLDYDGVTLQFQRWLSIVYRRLFYVFQRFRVDYCVEHNVRRCTVCFRCVLINEIPFVTLKIDRYFEPLMFFLTKTHWPAAQFYRKAEQIISVTLISGIIMIPMILDGPSRRSSYPRINSHSVLPLANDVWIRCENCSRYFPFHAYDRSSNIVIVSDTVQRQLSRLKNHLTDLYEVCRDGGIPCCERHVWFSSNDLEYYETYVVGETLGPPFVYEIACHGLLLNCAFMHATDISKLTVSINASRRRLRTATCLDNYEMEMLVDQNSRMSVRRWAGSEFYDNNNDNNNDDNNNGNNNNGNRNDRNDDDLVRVSENFVEPLHGIVELPENNMFQCCFMFGDFQGRNVEDAYVFDENSRPTLDNTVQLKMNFYRNDKLPIAVDSLRFSFKPMLTVYNSGVVFFLGDLISNHRLSFGSTFVHVKIVRVSEHLWIYKFYYINNASYLRQDEKIFERYESGGCEFVDETTTTTTTTASDTFESDNDDDDNDDDESHGFRGPRVRIEENDFSRFSNVAATTSVSLVRMLFERTMCTRNGHIRIRCQMTNRQLRFLVTLRGVRSVLKWQNNCGNKGVSSCVDLSDLYTSRGGRVHVIVSAYSTIGRQLVAQLLEQMSCGGNAFDYNDGRYMMRVYSRSANGRQVGWCGYGTFFFSCDSPHDTIIVSSPFYGNNATRMCNMTYFAAIGNNLSTWICNRSANHVNYRNNPINGMPLNINKCLSVYHFYNRQLYMQRLLLREYRKKMQDYDELRRRKIVARLPLSIKNV